MTEEEVNEDEEFQKEKEKELEKLKKLFRSFSKKRTKAMQDYYDKIIAQEKSYVNLPENYEFLDNEKSLEPLDTNENPFTNL